MSAEPRLSTTSGACGSYASETTRHYVSLLAAADSHLDDRRLRAVLFRAEEPQRRHARHGEELGISKSQLGLFLTRTACCTAYRSS